MKSSNVTVSTNSALSFWCLESANGAPDLTRRVYMNKYGLEEGKTYAD